MSEGEVLYPPQSKFKVTAVIQPKLFKDQEIPKYKLSPQQGQDLAEYDNFNLCKKQAFKKSNKTSGPEYQTELAKAYQEKTGKPLPSKATQEDIKAKALDVFKKTSQHNTEQSALISGINRDTNWVIQLQEF
jgi:hypothetical protein